jgi:hypothetical protein
VIVYYSVLITGSSGTYFSAVLLLGKEQYWVCFLHLLMEEQNKSLGL